MTHMPNADKSGSSQFDAYSDTYNDVVNSALTFTGMKVDFFTTVKMNYLIDIIQDTVPDADVTNVLDVRCGVGNAHPLLVDNVGRVTGIDVSQRCIERRARRILLSNTPPLTELTAQQYVR